MPGGTNPTLWLEGASIPAAASADRACAILGCWFGVGVGVGIGGAPPRLPPARLAPAADMVLRDATPLDCPNTCIEGEFMPCNDVIRLDGWNKLCDWDGRALIPKGGGGGGIKCASGAGARDTTTAGCTTLLSISTLWAVDCGPSGLHERPELLVGMAWALYTRILLRSFIPNGSGGVLTAFGLDATAADTTAAVVCPTEDALVVDVGAFPDIERVSCAVNMMPSINTVQHARCGGDLVRRALMNLLTTRYWMGWLDSFDTSTTKQKSANCGVIVNKSV